ncbi:bifunctional adenosylcobinamide kinase/adenosylcobinamide-phosphate guanylyltransferase [Sporosarcina sp. D27]|uniref:bifunctional adenosylcobinamide kinase/adenosylcobinamide-phosphate guanylyltransferase n=1 Tax=Sporosarcina sp. D27 TaxID=1382305 RepID=UPI00046F0D97|nr:bifunctional adenosylcobinamide kinase/adenosylcobinamide-phosphate guanylyltransferase [Sporosarcina sp. D27]
MPLPNHGANPHKLYEILNLEQPAKMLDFSENCNSAGPPEAIQIGWNELLPKISRYPDPNGEPFRTAVADFHGIGIEQLVLGNGAAEILSLIANRYRGKRAIIVHPTFSEYEATLTAAGASITHVQASEENGFALPIDELIIAMETADVLYICTPNNPTGFLPKRTELVSLIQHAATVACDVILDEAFIDWVDEALSFIPEVKNYPNVIVVRSMTKLYAIPGIRLGYAVARPNRIDAIKRNAPHWNINAIAAQLGTICLQQADYRERAIQQATEERLKMTNFLTARGCKVIDSVANFILFKPPVHIAAQDVFNSLLTRGIVLRHTENFKGLDGRWLRIGMKSASDMETLRDALVPFLDKKQGTLTFISGGVRSGKSAYAEQLARTEATRTGGRLVYIASGTATDDEMAKRIARHRSDRADDGWTTIEQPTHLENVLPNLQPHDHVIWDCVTTWLGNEAFEGWETGTPCILKPECMDQKITSLLDTIERIQNLTNQLIIVSNEVFDEPLKTEEITRTYTHTLGELHQAIVAKADTAIEMDSGLPIVHKQRGTQ